MVHYCPVNEDPDRKDQDIEEICPSRSCLLRPLGQDDGQREEGTPQRVRKLPQRRAPRINAQEARAKGEEEVRRCTLRGLASVSTIAPLLFLQPFLLRGR